MDASAYLRKQGWRGSGHSLDPSSRGIKKPLLVSKKVDALGVGLNKHSTVSDQWWLRAFDQGLKNLGTGEESVLASVQKHGINRGGLYGRFVKGERFAGSLGQTPQSSEVEDTTGTNSPAELVQELLSTMTVDITLEGELGGVAANHADMKGDDTVLHSLQHPKGTPGSMKKTSSQKRKRDERPEKKQARRKVDREPQMNVEAAPSAVEERHIPPSKLTEYMKRAAEKGITLDAYIRRREEKQAGKQAQKSVIPPQQNSVLDEKNDGEHITPDTEQPKLSDVENDDNEISTNGFGFIIDTEGDDRLASFPDHAGTGARQDQPPEDVDTTGEEVFLYDPSKPVPLDPRIWEGKKVKDLPKAVRKARKDWMAVRREERKARAAADGKVQKRANKKAKAQRKIEAREAFVREILSHSRNALRDTGDTNGTVTIDGVQDVPLVKVESREGKFKKTEMALARTVARRIARNAKREERAKKGKGKGWKKRERAKI